MWQPGLAGRVSSNALLNGLGQVLVAVVAIISLPAIVKRLGPDTFGILTLVYVAFGAIGILDLGLGRATAKVVSEFLASKRTAAIGPAILVSASIQFCMGATLGVGLFFARSFVTQRLLRMPAGLQAEGSVVCAIVAAALPVVLCSFALRGALEGAQRFDLVNSVKIPLNISIYLIPWVGALLGSNLSTIVAGLAITRLLGAYVFGLFCLRIFPHCFHARGLVSGATSSLFRFASWSSLSSVLVPCLVYIDRYLVATRVSLAAVTYYAVPFELINGLSAISSSVSSATFPAFSQLQATNDSNAHTTALQLYMRATRFLMLVLAPVTIVLVLFPKDLLRLWQGDVVAAKSAIPLQILAIGAFTNTLGAVPGSFLMGYGRPDLIGKIHLGQVLLYGPLVYFLASTFGVSGVAMAFSIRVTLETLLLVGASIIVSPSIRFVILGRGFFRSVLTASLFGVAATCIKLLCRTFAQAAAGLLGVSLLYAVVAWLTALDSVDRAAALSILTSARRSLKCS